MSVICAQIGFAQEAIPHPKHSGKSHRQSAAAALAIEVRSIATSSSLSVAKKERHISNAVRLAVVTATAYQPDAGHNLDIAIALATAAAKAAPRYTEVIANAVSFTPAVSRIDGAAGQIRSAAYAAAKGRPVHTQSIARADGDVDAAPIPRKHKRRAAPTPTPAEVVPDHEVADMSVPAQSEPSETAPSSHRAGRREEVVETAPTEMTEEARGSSRESESMESNQQLASNEYADNTAPEGGSNKGIPITTSGNSVFHTTADISIRHDDNVFLSNGINKVSDEIIDARPGIDYAFGQNTLTHGTVAVSEDFSRYVHKSAPNARLTHASADFGYSNGRLTIAAQGAYNQSYENNRDIAASLKARQLVRSSETSVNSSAEMDLSPKTSLSTGFDYANLKYKDSDLSGNDSLTIPLNAYYKITPKTDLSAGVSFTSDQVDNIPGKDHDRYYNIGARGEFTPKLTGNISVGERRRRSQAGQTDSLLGFDGTLNYEVTAKTSAALTLNRDFSVSAFGQSLHNSGASLKLATTFTPQWDGSVSLGYHKIDYGFFLDTTGPLLTKDDRQDSYWEGSASVSYVYTSWFTTSLAYTLRTNHSTLNAAEFSNNVITLLASLRY